MVSISAETMNQKAEVARGLGRRPVDFGRRGIGTGGGSGGVGGAGGDWGVSVGAEADVFGASSHYQEEG